MHAICHFQLLWGWWAALVETNVNGWSTLWLKARPRVRRILPTILQINRSLELHSRGQSLKTVTLQSIYMTLVYHCEFWYQCDRVSWENWVEQECKPNSPSRGRQVLFDKIMELKPCKWYGAWTLDLAFEGFKYWPIEGLVLWWSEPLSELRCKMWQ